MADNRNRKRPIQVKFFVDEKEQALIKKKVELAGSENITVLRPPSISYRIIEKIYGRNASAI